MISTTDEVTHFLYFPASTSVSEDCHPAINTSGLSLQKDRTRSGSHDTCTLPARDKPYSQFRRLIAKKRDLCRPGTAKTDLSPSPVMVSEARGRWIEDTTYSCNAHGRVLLIVACGENALITKVHIRTKKTRLLL